MKRILFALTMLGLLLPLAPRAQADTDVSLNFFYDNLSDQGSWLEVGDYGYVYQPNVAVDSSDWRPYSDGYWAYTDAGWTWVSYEDFGWATYHYGRWANLDSYGWVWVPGYEWGPAWVSWRTGGDYVGWAPLPPQGADVVYEGRAITGAVDVTFGIGPLYYNFVDIRYIGEPVLRSRLIPASRNVTIINNTVNVTNITYNNSVVINNGPDLARVNQFSTRPVQRLTLQRETTVSGDFASRRGNLNRVNGSTLMVAAPTVQRSQEKFAPKQVKAKVAQPKFEKGWQGINNRAQVEQEMKKENAQNVPPPTFQPKKAGKAEAAGAAQTGAQPNENADAPERAPAAGNDRAANKAAREAQRENRGQNAAQPNAAENAGQGAEQRNQQNAREQKRQPADQRRAESVPRAQDAGTQNAQPGQADEQNAGRGRRAAEQKAQREQSRQQDQLGQQEAENARVKAERDREAAASQPDRAQERERGQQQVEAQRAERAQQQEAQRAERAQRAEKAQEAQRAERPERPQQTERPQRAERPPQAERPQPTERPQQAERPQRAERPQPAQRPDRAQRPQEGRPDQPANQNPNGPRKGKRNQPTEEPSPQG
ncbi:MAG: DUF6600 domain-containing protein [Spartobacteria bacterium]